jgi:hypothetical protein
VAWLWELQGALPPQSFGNKQCEYRYGLSPSPGDWAEVTQSSGEALFTMELPNRGLGERLVGAVFIGKR